MRAPPRPAPPRHRGGRPAHPPLHAESQRPATPKPAARHPASVPSCLLLARAPSAFILWHFQGHLGPTRTISSSQDPGFSHIRRDQGLGLDILGDYHLADHRSCHADINGVTCAPPAVVCTPHVRTSSHRPAQAGRRSTLLPSARSARACGPAFLCRRHCQRSAPRLLSLRSPSEHNRLRGLKA